MTSEDLQGQESTILQSVFDAQQVKLSGKYEVFS